MNGLSTIVDGRRDPAGFTGTAFRTLAAEEPLAGCSVHAESWLEYSRALHTHRKGLLALPGVMGLGPGYRRRGGEKTEERCAIVFVDCKRSLRVLKRVGAEPIPEWLSTGTANVPVDVVELGRLRRQAAGDEVGAKGGKRGTIGAFALDLALGGKAAITAMHLFDGKPVGGVTSCASPAPGKPGSTRIGLLRRGTKDGIDAAVISLASGVTTSNRLPVFGQMRGPRELTTKDQGLEVGLWGAETRTAVVGMITDPMTDIPEERLKSAILADIHTVEGDSGAPLVDMSGALLGFLVGEMGPKSAPVRVFTPAKLVLEVLACHIPKSGILT